MKKYNRGISLIAIMIVIIIMIILSGVIISLALDDTNIISKAENATKAYGKGILKEELVMALSNLTLHSVDNPLGQASCYESKEDFIINSKLDMSNKEIEDYLVTNENNNILMTIKIKDRNEKYSFNFDINKMAVNEIDSIDSSNYTIQYVLDGGTNSDEITTYREGESITLTSPIKDGYMFEGWYQASDFTGNKFIKITPETTGNLKLYARWVSITPEAYFTWTTSGTNATITGLSTTGLELYNAGNLTKLIFPRTYSDGAYTVTTVKASAFSGKTNIDNVIIPYNITTIEKKAFYDCGKTSGELTVTLESGRTSLSAAFLQGANYLKTIVVPSGVTSIKGYSNASYDEYSTGAFRNCVLLTDVTIPSSVTEIGPYVFFGCTSLRNIQYGTGVTTIALKTYKNCTGLTELSIPSSITEIKESAFYGCTNLGRIVFPETNLSLGGSCFSGCTSLSNITIPTNVISIESNCFSNCGKTAGELTVTIEAGRTKLSIEFLQGANYLKTITIPAGITTIDGYDYVGRPEYSSGAFKNCTNLNSIIIPSSVTTIGAYALYNCTGLTTITYQDTVEKWNAITKSSNWRTLVPDTTTITCTNGTV